MAKRAAQFVSIAHRITTGFTSRSRTPAPDASLDIAQALAGRHGQ
jgi:hypothetical protein